MTIAFNLKHRLTFLAALVLSLISTISLADNSNFTILHTNDWQSRLLGFGPNADFTPETINNNITLSSYIKMPSEL